MCTTSLLGDELNFSVFTTFQTKREKNSFHVQLKKIKKQNKKQNKKQQNTQNKKHMGGIGKNCMHV